ncbi:VOC family protein [Fuscovulum ytuae]|uniref:VOC family protein n=1 Tax=Fuscovulum ytuae TaxID=3042299 RepID=A0ABY8Q869_9RHOB|nr:VOC family protein [Fuscovulum sp. YMD61]WGV16467.1 VOC family protein [Fuscovulum sp. YMD61]
MLRLDHLAVSCLALEDGAGAVEAALGLPLAPGGQHAHMATHNRLLSLGPDLYLEVIAPDPAQTGPAWPRWFDLDRFTGPPRLTNWICATDDLDAALALAPEGTGTPVALARGDFRWRMAVPANGILPFDNRYPALIEWEGAAHPAPRLPDHGARLMRLEVAHPDAPALRAALASLNDPRVVVVAGPPALRAIIATPEGDRVLA